jgi:hypothetical protein
MHRHEPVHDEGWDALPAFNADILTDLAQLL